jgi:hypothetical protein
MMNTEHGMLNDECGTLLQCSVFNIPCLPASPSRSRYGRARPA